MKPILFNTEMVRAILDGRKTVTRRVVKPQPKGRLIPELPNSCWPGYFGEEGTPRVVRPPYFIGDILYVRETFFKDNAGKYHYKADDNPVFFAEDIGHGLGWQFVEWRPSIHMPKEAARLFQRVKDVRVERLQDIKNDEAVDEGAVKRPNITKRGDLVLHNRYRAEFAALWNRTIKPADLPAYGWEANPWVWVIEFERISKEEALKRMEEVGDTNDPTA